MELCHIVPINPVVINWDSDRVTGRLFHNFIEHMSLFRLARRRQLSEARRQGVVSRACRVVMDRIGVDKCSHLLFGTIDLTLYLIRDVTANLGAIG